MVKFQYGTQSDYDDAVIDDSTIYIITDTQRIYKGSLLVGNGIIDTSLSSSSTNAVQNKVIYTAINNKQDKMTIDAVMKDNSTNTVQNKVIKAYVDSEINSAITEVSELIGEV